MTEFLIAAIFAFVLVIGFVLGLVQGAKMAKREIDRRVAADLDLPIEPADPDLPVRYAFTLPDGRGNVYGGPGSHVYLRRDSKWYVFAPLRRPTGAAR